MTALSRRCATFAVTLAVLAAGSRLQAQSPLWGSLVPGPHAVGFRAFFESDRSRSWLDARADPPVPGWQRTRPVRIALWYPARPGDRPHMKFGDYLKLGPRPSGDSAHVLVSAALEARGSWMLRDGLGFEAFDRLLEDPVAAARDAPPLDGPFPLVLYSAGFNDLDVSNFVLAEYLASHGFVVASVPQLGASPLALELAPSAADFEMQARDVEFALGLAGSFPFVDRTHLAAVGHSMGGAVSLLLMVRNPEVDAVVGLDASYGLEGRGRPILGSPFFRASAAGAPVLDIRRQAPDGRGSVLDSLRYSDRYLWVMPDIAHGDFVDWALLRRRYGGGNTQFERSARAYESINRAVERFLTAVLRNDATARRYLGDSIPGVRFQPGAEPPPSAARYVEWAATEGAGRAVARWREVQRRDPMAAVPDLRWLIEAADWRLSERKTKAAIEVFRFAGEVAPGSSVAYEGLGRAHQLDGNRGQAIRAYEHALEILERDTTLSADQRAEARQSMDRRLEGLRVQR